MITLTTEFLDDNWRTLAEGAVLPISLSEWDDGDAYTQASLGPLSYRPAFGVLVLGDKVVSDFAVVIRFSRTSDGGDDNSYAAPDGSRYKVTGERRKAGVAESHEVAIHNLRSSLGSRRTGLLESTLLAKRSVAVIGVGTGGVHVAIELAKAGVGFFSFVDPDRLEIGNVSRHHAGVSFVGRRKVYAARDLVLENNPLAHVEVFPVRADESTRAVLQRVIEGSDLVVCATDSRPSKLFVNTLCVQARRTAIFGGAFRRAYGGQILRVRPLESACYHCFVLAMPDTEADREVSSPEDAAEIAYSDQPVAVEPGLSIDVAPISIMVGKLALQELIRGQDSTLHMLDKDLDAGWYLWINRPEPGTKYASWPPLSECSEEMTILRWYGIYMEKERGCPTCGDFREVLKVQYGVIGGGISEPETRSFPSSDRKHEEG